MKDIKDYLHLYLGCGFITENSQGELNHLILSNVIDMIDIGKRVQLLLRPLSDMTEEEENEHFDIYEKYPATDSLKEYNIGLSAAQTNYLRSKYIDVDGLIEAGLAIDKTTLK